MKQLEEQKYRNALEAKSFSAYLKTIPAFAGSDKEGQIDNYYNSFTKVMSCREYGGRGVVNLELELRNLIINAASVAGSLPFTIEKTFNSADDNWNRGHNVAELMEVMFDEAKFYKETHNKSPSR